MESENSSVSDGYPSKRQPSLQPMMLLPEPEERGWRRGVRARREATTSGQRSIIVIVI